MKCPQCSNDSTLDLTVVNAEFACSCGYSHVLGPTFVKLTRMAQALLEESHEGTHSQKLQKAKENWQSALQAFALEWGQLIDQTPNRRPN